MIVINLFCDASIDLQKKVACAGCEVLMQNEFNELHRLNKRYIIQLHATNNSAEVLAIWIGVVEAIKLRQYYPYAVFRLFSDSKISLCGVKDWMKDWVRRSDGSGVLKSSSGQPVMNQQTFIEIYNLIIETGLRIEFYHQRGHVLDGKVSKEKARAQFIATNKVPFEGLGLSMEVMCQFNSLVDSNSRKALYNYLNEHRLSVGVEIQGEIPMTYLPRYNMVDTYVHNINKTSIRSKHDFKGGYNQ